jgi:hypothetical protein
MHGGRLSLTALGRDMPGPAGEKHRIKAADRLLGNRAIQAVLPKIYQTLAVWLLRKMPRPVLLVDWTGCGPNQFLLRVGVPFAGRSILLHGVVVSRRKLATRGVHTVTRHPDGATSSPGSWDQVKSSNDRHQECTR